MGSPPYCVLSGGLSSPMVVERSSSGLCEHSSEPSGSIKDGNFYDEVSNFQLLKDSVPWNLLSEFIDLSLVCGKTVQEVRLQR